MQTERLKYLVARYAAETASGAELEELHEYLKQSANDASVQAVLLEELENTNPATDYDEARWNNVKERIFNAANEQPVISMNNSRRSLNWKRMAAAAVLIVALGSGLYYFQHNKQQTQVAGTLQSRFGSDVAPGGNKALLTLANGSVIVLDTAANGALAMQNGMAVKKLSNGQLVYEVAGNGTATGELAYNTIATPRGGQYQVVLPDGSKVWLNASSSLRFPVSFGKERKVSLAGEAYFEIAKNANAPFKVTMANSEVQVLGTSFNINTYDNETLEKTTLVEGSVKVSYADDAVLLAPGKQLQLNKAKRTIAVKSDVDMKKVLAWKNGVFDFTGEDLATIMRQVERWYDVDVNFQGNPSDEKFVGSIPRNTNLSALLEVLTNSGVHFKIEGKKMTVVP